METHTGEEDAGTPTKLILKSTLAMFWARLGSLNALETLSTARFWKRWLAGDMISADTMDGGMPPWMWANCGMASTRSTAV